MGTIKEIENENAILDDYEHQVNRKIERYADRADFPRLEDFGYTREELSSYLFDRQAILDSAGSTRSQLTTGGIIALIPILVISAFPEKSLPWGADSLFVGIAAGLLLGLLYKVLMALVIRIRLRRMSDARMEEYLNKVIQYNA